MVGFLAERKKRGLAIYVLFIAFIYFLVFQIITSDRLFHIGTIEQYNSGTIPHIITLPIWFLIIFLGISIIFIILIIILFKLGKDLDVPWGELDQARLDKKKKAVSLIKAGHDLKASILSSLDYWDGREYIKELLEERNNTVIIKPNFAGGGKDKVGTQTSAEVLSVVIDIIREISPKSNIKVVESDNIFWRLTVLLKNSKYEKLLTDKKVEFLNLTKGEKVLYDFGGRMGEELISKILLEPHVLVDVPVAKTHAWYRMSGAIKNLFGLPPAHHKLLRYHAKGFGDMKGQIFTDIYRSFTPDLVILDGTISCEGNGPYGKPKKTDFIMTSDDALSTDIILARIMGFHEKQIPYLNILYKEGLKCEITLLGEPIDSIKPDHWKKAKKYGLLLNLIKIWAENIKIKISKKKS